MPNSQQSDLASLLLQCRSDLRLSMESVARATKLSKKTLSNIELRLHKPRRTTFVRLKEFLAKHGYFVKEEAA